MKELFVKLKQNKLAATMYIVSIIVIITLVISITYAFFEAQSLAAGISNVNVEFGSLDEYLITGGNSLSLNVTPTTLPENGSNQVATTTAQVSLKKNPAKTTDLSKEYNVYLSVSNNTFLKTNSSRAEILLNVYLNNQEVSITGLTQVTEGNVTGYDVTETFGLIPIAVQTITSTSSDTATVQNWEFKLTYLNLDIDQSLNLGASFKSNIIIKKTAIVQQTIYRYNEVQAPHGITIIPETGTLWVITDGTNDVYNFEDQASCTATLAQYGNPPGYSCVEKTGTFGGIGDYETNLNTLLSQTYTVYCPIGDNHQSCTSDWHFYDTEEECLEDGFVTYNGYTCQAGSITRPFYLKHNIEDDMIAGTEACLYYNNHEFCEGYDYWVETGNGNAQHQSTENGVATKNKLQTAMETKLGIQANNCT